MLGSRRVRRKTMPELDGNTLALRPDLSSLRRRRPRLLAFNLQSVRPALTRVAQGFGYGSSTCRRSPCPLRPQSRIGLTTPECPAVMTRVQPHTDFRPHAERIVFESDESRSPGLPNLISTGYIHVYPPREMDPPRWILCSPGICCMASAQRRPNPRSREPASSVASPLCFAAVDAALTE